MSSEFRLPALGADMDAGTIVEWHVAPGSHVKRGDVVAVVETDKGAIDVEIFEDGVVREIVVPVGQKVPVGTVLARLDTEGEAAGFEASTVAKPGVAPREARPSEAAPPAAAPATAAPAPVSARAKVSPAARRRARELGIEVDSLQGTGADGAVTLADVARASKTGGAPQPAAAETAVPRRATSKAGDLAESRSSMRAAIASAMSKSKREIPHYYLATSVDVTPTTEWLAAHNADVPVTERLLFAALLTKALALTCREAPGFSGFYRDGRYEESPAVHVGVAVALRGGGLVAPAIANTADQTLSALMTAMRELVTRARAGRLRASELAAPTIVLTSLGEDSVDTVFPIIQPPQVAIVGAGAVVERPWVVEGKIVPRKLISLSLGADHRVTDGRLGAQFLARLARRICDPATL
jgi:pyruvate dehydrogenase E2 component (dihydrolipoamide acetyltransferase)